MPTTLKILRGNPGRRPLNRHEPQPRVRKPTCPPGLSAAARKVWRATCAELQAMGVLASSDTATIEIYARSVAFMRASAELLDAGGPLVKGRGGTLVKNPAGAGYVQQATLVLKCAAELGLTPSARTRVERPDTRDDEIARKYFGA